MVVKAGLLLPLPDRLKELEPFERCRAIDDFHASIFMLDQSGAAFDPVAAVVVGDRAAGASLSLVNVPADDSVESLPLGRVFEYLFKPADELAGGFHFEFDPLRERRIG